MEHQDVMTGAAAWMSGRGWRQKLARRRGSEQTLFEHSLIELDLLLEMFPVLESPRHYGLSETEKQVLVVAVLAHDVGKETDAWQAYIHNPQPDRRTSHIVPELTRAVVPELCATVEAQVLGEFCEQHYRKWPDEPIPALGNRTPREAARLKTMRPRLIALLKEFENRSERLRREGRPAPDFGWMWEELGLERP